MPIYGRAFESTNGIRQSFNGIGPGTWEAGVYDYKALPMAGATVTENTAEGASYSYDSSKKELVTYDTPNIVKLKSNYIISKNMAGAMFWVSCFPFPAHGKSLRLDLGCTGNCCG